MRFWYTNNREFIRIVIAEKLITPGYIKDTDTTERKAKKLI